MIQLKPAYSKRTQDGFSFIVQQLEDGSHYYAVLYNRLRYGNRGPLIHNGITDTKKNAFANCNGVIRRARGSKNIHYIFG